jgi:5-methylthioribose kinase
VTSVGAIAAFLRAHDLAEPGESLRIEALAGGVSSDIWAVTTATRTICVKRALARLRVAGTWEAPTSRNAAEYAWLELVSHLVPDAVPELFADDRTSGMFAMAYLEPTAYPVWKSQLRDGIVQLETATQVGDRLGTIHAQTADDRSIAARFANDASFAALRLHPYLHATASAHPDLRDELATIADTTATTKRVLVHGDVSPKNLLIGPNGPVFLDAECAWFGDPAFDLSFVLNHLLLKSVWRPHYADAYVAAFRALTTAYEAHVHWEPLDAFERRCAGLLPALTLARIDGLSPVEYLTDERDRENVRRTARALIRSAPESIGGVLDRWLRSAVTAA